MEPRRYLPKLRLILYSLLVKLLPEWVPGTGFKETARRMGAELNVVVEKPYAFVKHQISQEKNKASFVSRLLEAGEPNAEEEFFNKWSAMTMYSAGADTVSPNPF